MNSATVYENKYEEAESEKRAMNFTLYVLFVNYSTFCQSGKKRNFFDTVRSMENGSDAIL